MSAKRGRANGSLEQEIIVCLAASDAPMTAAEVRAELDGELAYTTVMTILSRLYAKHALLRSTKGRAFAYELVDGVSGSAASVTAHQMHRLLEAGPDRSSVLARFISNLDGESEELLRSLLRDHDQRGRT